MEEQIRLAAFQWLKNYCELHGDVIPRSVLADGFVFKQERITLLGPSGIWKPRQFQIIPLSITTILGGP